MCASEIDKERLISVARTCNSVGKLAKALGTTASTLLRWMRHFGLETKDLPLLPNKHPRTSVGIDPPNKGRSKADYEPMMKTSQSAIGKKFSEEHRRKLSEAAKRRVVNGMAGKKHSDATREKIRQKTLQQLASGKIKQTRTRPHLRVMSALDEMEIKYTEEAVISCYSVDFLVGNVCIEVNGDYWHCNPDFWPSPATKSQKVNVYRDKIKYAYLTENGYDVLILWENEINDGRFESKLRAALGC